MVLICTSLITHSGKLKKLRLGKSDQTTQFLVPFCGPLSGISEFSQTSSPLGMTSWRAIDSDLLLSLCQDSPGKLTIGHGLHPGAGRLPESLPEAGPDQGQYPGTGKIRLPFAMLLQGRVEVPLKIITCEEFEQVGKPLHRFTITGGKTLTQVHHT